MLSLSHLKDSYEKKKFEIKNRLKEFENLWKKTDKDIFTELCFCILTPQSKARSADEAIRNMQEKNILLSGKKDEIEKVLTTFGVRFPKNKAKFILEVRKILKHNEKIEIKNKLDTGSVDSKREWLVNNIKGMGFKEASHFLRNIGLGFDLAILDRHILKNLLKYGVIKDIPKNLTKKQYLLIEEKMRKFSKKVNIPMADLDLLFWSEETGEIFK